MVTQIKPNYPRKAQAPYNKINKNSVITESENNTINGWVLVALDAKVRHLWLIHFVLYIHAFFTIFD